MKLSKINPISLLPTLQAFALDHGVDIKSTKEDPSDTNNWQVRFDTKDSKNNLMTVKDDYIFVDGLDKFVPRDPGGIGFSYIANRVKSITEELINSNHWNDGLDSTKQIQDFLKAIDGNDFSTAISEQLNEVWEYFETIGTEFVLDKIEDNAVQTFSIDGQDLVTIKFNTDNIVGFIQHEVAEGSLKEEVEWIKNFASKIENLLKPDDNGKKVESGKANNA